MNSCSSSRPTVALVLSRLAEKFQTHIRYGVVDAAEELGINLICIAGRSLKSPFPRDKFHNNLFRLAQIGNLDGILWMSGSIANFVSLEEYQEFLEAFKGIPQVSLSLSPKGMASVISDNSTGVREAILHLYHAHGLKRIAMIKGPEKHWEAATRYNAYCRTLDELGIPYDPDLVASGNFTLMSVPEALSLLLDQRQAKFDALVVANDEMAFTASKLLQQRGYRIPEDIAVVGFDDCEGAVSASPPLTTVHQPLYELGYRGMENLAALLRGEAISQSTILPTFLVVRRSCGCYSRTIQEVQCLTAIKNLDLAVDKRKKVIADLLDKAESGILLLDRDNIVRLTHTVFDDLERQTGSFLRELSYAVSRHERSRVWHGFISEFRLCAAPYLKSDEIIAMESLLQKARILLGEVVNEAEMRDRLRIELQSLAISESSHGLMTVLDFDGLKQALANSLPNLEIPSCYLALFSESGSPTEESRLIIAYGKGKGNLEEIRFPTRQWIPDGLWSDGRRYSYVVEALHFRDEMLGYVVFEMGPREGAIYEALAAQIGAAVKGILLYEERNRTEAALRENQRVLSTMMSNLPGMAYRCQEDANWTMEFVSEGCQALTGYSPQALLDGGPAYSRIVHPEDLDRIRRTIREQLQKELPFQITYRIVTASGETRWVWEQGRGVRGESGRIVAIEGLIIDVTERRRAEDELTLSLEKLRQSVESTIMAMALTVEIRDPYTAGHQRRVAQLASAIAAEMGLSEEQIDQIRLAAAIHDLGKIRIPAEILSKPGKITPIEFRLIQTHSEVGFDILKTMDFPWPIEQIVLQHHERLDGSGYPLQLKGEEILLEARIIAVADVVEAMSSHRPYRPALGLEKALDEIRKKSGILYDEGVVNTCLALFERGFIFEMAS